MQWWQSSASECSQARSPASRAAAHAQRPSCRSTTRTGGHASEDGRTLSGVPEARLAAAVKQAGLDSRAVRCTPVGRRRHPGDLALVLEDEQQVGLDDAARSLAAELAAELAAAREAAEAEDARQRRTFLALEEARRAGLICDPPSDAPRARRTCDAAAYARHTRGTRGEEALTRAVRPYDEVERVLKSATPLCDATTARRILLRGQPAFTDRMAGYYHTEGGWYMTAEQGARAVLHRADAPPPRLPH